MIFILGLSLVITDLYAQDSTRVVIEAGKSFYEVLTPDKIYGYRNFSKGKVFFRDGTISESRLNYNLLNGEIEFIDAGGDTLAIADEQIPDIQQVCIDTNFFFYSNGFLEQVLNLKDGRLLRRQKFILLEKERIGGYNMASSTQAIQTYSGFIADSRNSVFSSLRAKQNLTLILVSEYFIGDRFNKLLPANKKNMIKMYPSKKQKIEDYLKVNPVDFRNGTDLKKLFEHLSSLFSK